MKRKITGTIPSCVFQLPLLQSLYLSGNELSGNLNLYGVNITSSPLTNVRLSYNKLTGEFPAFLESKSWEILDLSYNKIQGNLHSHFDQDISKPLSQTTISAISQSFDFIPPSWLREYLLLSVNTQQASPNVVMDTNSDRIHKRRDRNERELIDYNVTQELYLQV